MNGLPAIEKNLGYVFEDKGLLKTAMTHTSRASESGLSRASSNERLEFFGDSLLGFLAGKIIFSEFPGEDEGVLSKIKAYWVSAEVLASMAEGIGIREALILGVGEERGGGRNNTRNLANAFEALIAAVYLDGGVRKAEKVVSSLFKSRMKRSGKDVLLYDAKTRLQEFLQERFKEKPSYLTGPAGGAFVSEAVFRGEVIGSGRGATKKKAEQEAAKAALARLSERF